MLHLLKIYFFCVCFTILNVFNILFLILSFNNDVLTLKSIYYFLDYPEKFDFPDGGYYTNRTTKPLQEKMTSFDEVLNASSA